MSRNEDEIAAMLDGQVEYLRDNIAEVQEAFACCARQGWDELATLKYVITALGTKVMLQERILNEPARTVELVVEPRWGLSPVAESVHLLSNMTELRKRFLRQVGLRPKEGQSAKDD